MKKGAFSFHHCFIDITEHDLLDNNIVQITVCFFFYFCLEKYVKKPYKYKLYPLNNESCFRNDTKTIHKVNFYCSIPPSESTGN